LTARRNLIEKAEAALRRKMAARRLRQMERRDEERPTVERRTEERRTEERRTEERRKEQVPFEGAERRLRGKDRRQYVRRVMKGEIPLPPQEEGRD
jgi:hypothetical protein